MSAVNAAGARLAVDIGGTFTDIVLEARNRRWTGKVLTTPRAPEEAVVGAVQEILAQAEIAPQSLRHLHTRHDARYERADRAQGR
jgi:N-methylhydantoinase A